MSCIGRTLCFGVMLLVWLSASPPGFAQQAAASPAAALPEAVLPAHLLPAVPSFQLTLPSLPLPSNQWLWLQQEGSPATAYWQTAQVPREWRDARDDELRLELETGHRQLGAFSLASEIDTVPGRERDCDPGCHGASWSSTLRLKYEMGDLGPMRQTGPDLSVGYTPARPGVKSQGLLRGGFSGKF